MCDPIQASERLNSTLRHLVSGDAQVSNAASYCINPCVVGCAIRETCQLLWGKLNEKGFLRVPSCTEGWKKIVKVFEKK